VERPEGRETPCRSFSRRKLRCLRRTFLEVFANVFDRALFLYWSGSENDLATLGKRVVRLRSRRPRSMWSFRTVRTFKISFVGFQNIVCLCFIGNYGNIGTSCFQKVLQQECGWRCRCWAESDIDRLILRENRGCEKKNVQNGRPTSFNQIPPPNFAGEYSIEDSTQSPRRLPRGTHMSGGALIKHVDHFQVARHW
jgi:hypothetical protein